MLDSDLEASMTCTATMASLTRRFSPCRVGCAAVWGRTILSWEIDHIHRHGKDKIMTEPIRIEYGQEREQFGDLHLPSGTGPHPVLVVLHGGRWQASSTLQGIAAACASLAQGGLAVWNVEYRRLGNAGGGWPGTWEDVAAATDHLKGLAAEHALDLDRVV